MPFFSIRPTGIFNLRSRRKLPFLLRQIITTGYVAAGYKDSVPWRNVNSLNQATDTTTNHGDLLQETANYTSGAHNRNNAFIWGTGGVGAFTSTSCFNMRNNTTLTKTAAMNTAYTVGDSGTMQDHDEDGNTRWSWQTGGQGAAVIQKFNMTTETHQGTLSTGYTQGGIGSSAMFDELFGYFHTETNNNMRFAFVTETQSTPSFSPGFHSQQKSIGSKLGKGVAGNEGSYNAGYNFRRTNFTTETSNGTVAKPIGNSGEENFTIGQNHHWMLGMYDGGGQNNKAWKYSYITDSGFQGGASMEPTGSGIAGRSSGHGYWRD